MRGKAAETLTDSGWIRITPAYAGKSGCVSAIFAKYSGSPPPMRGKVAFDFRHTV